MTPFTFDFSFPVSRLEVRRLKICCCITIHYTSIKNVTSFKNNTLQRYEVQNVKTEKSSSLEDHNWLGTPPCPGNKL